MEHTCDDKRCEMDKKLCVMYLYILWLGKMMSLINFLLVDCGPQPDIPFGSVSNLGTTEGSIALVMLDSV